MTIVGIIVIAYLVIGGLAASVIWAALIASKQHNDKKAAKANYKRLEFSAFRRHDTKPIEGRELS